MIRKYFIGILVLSAVLSACTPSASPVPGEPQTLTVMTHSSFAVSDAVKAEFEQKYNARLEFLAAGDTGTALNKAILAKGQPLADVFYGIDNTFLSRALAENIFEPYASPAVAGIPTEFLLDPQQRALPVDYGDVCLNYDINFFDAKKLSPPQSLEDLLKPEYRDMLVVENPATSSPGLAFMLTTIGYFGTEEYLGFWQSLVENGMKVVNDWETAYYTEFSRSGGTRPIVVSYSSSPAFEVIYADPPVDTPPTAAITSPGTCFRQVEFVGILAGTPQRDLAEKWVDFMLSATFQEDMPMQMFVFPVLPGVELDERFTTFLDNPEKTASVDPNEIAAQREAWLKAWTETVLR
jgi:thiamine transport system substrate-binding protein